MKAMRGLLVLCLSVGYGTLFAQGGSTADPQVVVGVWRGHSVCIVRDSPCHDEVNVYHVSAIPSKPGIYFVSGNKIVDGKEEVMGTGEWKYDAIAHVLSHEVPHGVFRLKLEGGKMEGDLKLPDGTLFRQIFLEKDK
jgi:hypothetical protein